MKSETFKGTVERAYGKDLPKAVEFSGSFDAYESYEEASKANDLLSNEEHLAAVNAKRKAAARAAATAEALQAAGIEKPNPNSPAVIQETMIKSLMKLHGLSREVAEQILSSASAAATAVKA